MRNYSLLLRWFVLVGIILLAALPGRGDSLPEFRNISIMQGLSQNTVLNLTQDKRGFMWFGTNDGINRYDGQHFKVYRFFHPNPLIVTDNYILASGRDTCHNLWISTLHGIKQYACSQDCFYDVLLKKDTSLIQCPAESLVCDRKNGMLAATTYGLLRYDSIHKVFRQVLFNDGNQYTSDYFVSTLSPGGKYPVYAGITGKGIAVYSEKENKLCLINHEIKEFNNLIRCGDSLYVGNNNGVHILKIVKGSALCYTGKCLLSGKIIKTVSNTDDGTIWIGTDGNGLWLYNPRKNSIQTIPSGINPGEIRSKAICSVFQDRKGGTWVGTMFGGIEYASAKKNSFNTRQCARNLSPAGNFVNCFAEDSEGNIWIGTDGGGIFYYDPVRDLFCNNKLLQKINANAGDVITCMGIDPSNNLWIGSYGKGVTCVNLTTGLIKNYTVVNSSLLTDFIWSCLICSDGSVWIGAMAGAGLFHWNPQKQDFDRHILNGQNIYALAETSNGELLAGTQNAFFSVSLQNGQIKNYSIGVGVRSILYKDNILWLGTEGRGLLKYDTVNKTFFSPFPENGISVNNNILSLLQDSIGYLWAGTFDGLYRIEPETESIVRFDVDDGLQSNQFNYFEPLITHTGHFYFGGINGFTCFNPLQVVGHNDFVPLYITRFQGFTDDSTQLSIYDMDFQEVEFPYDKQGFLLEFTTPDFDAARKIKYAYRFEGDATGWNEVGGQQQIIFPRLKEGTYQLYIRNSDHYGNWNPQARLLVFRILPPFYRSIWAWFFYTLIFLITIFTIYWQKRKQYRIKNALLIADMKLEQQQELSELKERFFINISHELRTPLTLILAPLKDLLSTGRCHAAEREELVPVYNSALILWQRMNQLLLFRKAEKTEQLTYSFGNLVALVEKCCKKFEQLATHQEVIFSFPKEEPDILLWYDVEKIKVILDNLLSNAFKFTPRGGNITVTVTQNGAFIELQVSDSGCGIPVHLQKQIFDRYYSHNSSSGMGIGLALVKQYTEMHGGEILVSGEIGEGSCFKVRLPLKLVNNSVGEKIIENSEENDFSFLAVEKTEKSSCKIQNTDTDISGAPVVLIVEDHEELRSFIVRLLLRHGGYMVYESANGSDAWQKIPIIMPDLIISDVMMPELNGTELCRQVKSNASTSHIYIILITADLSERTEILSREYGADDFLTKPFDTEKLFAKLKNALYTRQRLQAYFRKQLAAWPVIEPTTVNQEEIFVNRCIAVIRKQGLQEDFSVIRLAEETGMSQSALYKKVKVCTGQTVNELIRSVRLAVAAEMLIADKNVSEVAYETGFSDLKYFREVFKKQFGVLPSAYKKNIDSTIEHNGLKE